MAMPRNVCNLWKMKTLWYVPIIDIVCNAGFAF